MMRSAHFVVLVSMMLGAAAPGLGRATPAPPLPPCVPASADVTVAALGAILAGQGDYHVRRCAALDLAARGAAAVPVVVGTLGSRDSDTVKFALNALSKMGPQAQAALPALMDWIRTPSPALQENDLALYDAVGAIGAGARPAIPLLIVRSRDPRHRFSAVEALGVLGKYDAARVVPHLASILESQKGEGGLLEAQHTLDAIRKIGKQARAALPATLASLEEASEAFDWMHGGAAVRTLVAIAEPSESIPVLTELLHHPMLARRAVDGLALMGPAAAGAVPALIHKLDHSREQPLLAGMIVSALADIAPQSAVVQQKLLVEATQHQTEWAAFALSRIGPLPSHFAPALAAALAKKPGDFFLSKALENTRRAK